MFSWKLYIYIIIIIIVSIYQKNIHDSEKNIHYEFLEKFCPETIELCYFDNGFAGYWYNVNKSDHCYIILCGTINDFYKDYKNYFEFIKLFPNDQILFIESPISFCKNNGPSIKMINHSYWNEQYLTCLENLYRKPYWKTMSFIGMDTSCLYILYLSIKYKCEKILLFNCPKYSFNFINDSLNIESIITKISLNTPIIFFHTRHNPKISYLESLYLFKKIELFHPNSKWLFLQGIYNQCLLSIENKDIILSNL